MLGLLARVVDEQLVAGAMDLPHRQKLRLLPRVVVRAELRVPVRPDAVLLEVLVVQQSQRHAGLAQLDIERRRIRQRSLDVVLNGVEVRTR
jgi:hypothetical protein